MGHSDSNKRNIPHHLLFQDVTLFTIVLYVAACPPFQSISTTVWSLLLVVSWPHACILLLCKLT